MTCHLAIVGPTGAGKSQIALQIAARAGDAEIVSLDSMQVYRGLDIGTAKASAAEQAVVPHHLIDVAEPDDVWSVARTQAAARAVVADIEARNKRAVLVGGTGLYVQAVVDAFELPGEDLAVRAELEAATSEAGGLLAAWAELRSADPVAAARIDEHNQRRIVRALEVIRSTGRPFSSFGPGVFAAGPTAFPVLLAGIWWSRAALAVRLARRSTAMREAGLVDEVRRVAPRLGRAASQAIGYKELLGALGAVAGDTSIDSSPDGASVDGAFDLALRRTRSFARRQRMWFRRDPRIIWFAPTPNTSRPATPRVGSHDTFGSGELRSTAGAVLACWRRTS